MTLRNKFVFFVALFILLFVVAIRYYTDNVGYFVFTTSPSLKHRFFYVDLRRKEPKRGEYIAFWLYPDKIISEKQRSIKEVVCFPGDVLEVRGRDYYCNGVYLGRAKERSKKGIPVDNFKWNGVIPDGMYFVMGVHPDSYDSRYYGFVSKERIIGVGKPLL
ncbi:MAG: signal peptidase I [Candidatus Aenigmatarchaeota archaeon]